MAICQAGEAYEDEEDGFIMLPDRPQQLQQQRAARVRPKGERAMGRHWSRGLSACHRRDPGMSVTHACFCPQGSEEEGGGWGMLPYLAGGAAALAGGALLGRLLADPEPAAADSAARLRVGDTVLYRGRAGAGAETGVIRQVRAA